MRTRFWIMKHIILLSSLSFLGVNSQLNLEPPNENATQWTYQPNNLRIDSHAEYTNELIQAFFNDAESDLIFEHGCWCAKFNQYHPNKSFLGGSAPMDYLDEICREYFKCRNCNDKLDGGECNVPNQSGELGAETIKHASYQMFIDDNDISNNYCVSEHVGASNCSRSTCEIDLFYMQQIRDFITANPFYTASEVTHSGNCTHHHNPEVKRCTGTAPNLIAERVADPCVDELAQACMANNINGAIDIDYTPGDDFFYISNSRSSNTLICQTNNMYKITVETLNNVENHNMPHYQTHAIGLTTRAVVPEGKFLGGPDSPGVIEVGNWGNGNIFWNNNNYDTTYYSTHHWNFQHDKCTMKIENNYAYFTTDTGGSSRYYHRAHYLGNNAEYYTARWPAFSFTQSNQLYKVQSIECLN